MDYETCLFKVCSVSLSVQMAYRATRLHIILKWGGALTPLGEAQAQFLGENLRKVLHFV